MTDVVVSGPLFDSRFGTEMAFMVEQAQYAVGNAVLERVQFNLDGSIRHPTPYYETQIIQQHRGVSEVIHDRGIVYGPWLEGTSRRNQTTRFKGYASFRRAAQEVQRLAPVLVGKIIGRYIGRVA
jgi:hypothetical protein